MKDHTKSNSEADHLKGQPEKVDDAGAANANDIREAFLRTLEESEEVGGDVEAPTATDESDVMGGAPEDATAPRITTAIRAYLENTEEAHQRRRKTEEGQEEITA